MAEIRPHLDALAAQALPTGGWGYAAGQELHLEPTCLALLALSLDAELYAEAIDKGSAALETCATPDGTYVLGRGREEAVWPTALVLFVHAARRAPEALVQRTAARLLALRGRIPESVDAAEMHDIDFRIPGWPWGEDNFSWAEPTAWACLALRAAGYGDQPRVKEGLRLLIDRAQDRGGINYGNRRVFGLLTEPIPGPTALMLLALQGHTNEPRVATAIRYLEEQARDSEDLEHLCWIKLALDVWSSAKDAEGRPLVTLDLAELDRRIAEAHQSRTTVNWVQPATVREALTALALGTGVRNVFRLPAESAHRDAPPPAPPSRGESLPSRLKWAVRGFALNAVGSMRPVAPQSYVHIANTTDYEGNLADILQRQYEVFRLQVPLKDKRVVLKPNLVEYHRGKVINTHPNVVAAAIELCRREGAAEVIVAEGPGHWRNVEYLVQASGLGDVLKHHKVPFVDLNHDEPVQRVNLGRLTRLNHLYLSRTIVSADVVISMPKLKTHHWVGATLSLKNLFGTLPGICYGWPKNELHWRGIDQSIVDIAVTRTPHLAIVDGIIGMEGDGPLNGTPKPVGALIMGSDLLAVDATCCRLMGLNPERIGYLLMGKQKKLGQLAPSAIQQVGEKIETLATPFETLPQFHGLRLVKGA